MGGYYRGDTIGVGIRATIIIKVLIRVRLRVRVRVRVRVTLWDRGIARLREGYRHVQGEGQR